MKLTNYLLPLALLLPLSVHAAVNGTNTSFPVGLWNTVHYKMAVKNTKPLNIQVCIQADGTWQSINATDGLGGRWLRKGNDVHLSGNGNTVGGTGDITLVTPYKLMTGTWQSWSLNEQDNTHNAYTSRWELASTTSCIVK